MLYLWTLSYFMFNVKNIYSYKLDNMELVNLYYDFFVLTPVLKLDFFLTRWAS